MQRLFKQFSFPGGIPSHVAPETPGSIHEGGELGYVLSHAYGAAFDNPDLIVAAVVGDGEAETGPLATGWHGNKFLNPGARRRGAADPASQRLQDREPVLSSRASRTRSSRKFLEGIGLRAVFRRRPRARAGCTSRWRRRSMRSIAEIKRIQREARTRGFKRPAGVADDRAALAQGLDVPGQSSTARSARTTGARTRCRWATWTSRATCASSSGG